MLTHPTQDKLHTLRLLGMAHAFEQQLNMDDIDSLSTEERLGLMVSPRSKTRSDRNG